MIDLSKLPQPAAKNIAVRVKPAAERAIRQGHPWVFDKAITRQSHLGNAGDLAVVYDQAKNNFLAVGLYDPFSPIRIKVLQRDTPERVDQAFFVSRLQAAQARRQDLIDSGTTGYRLVYGESDGFSSLVIDRYGDTLVIKLYSIAWIAHLKSLLDALGEAIAFERALLRLSRSLQSDQHDLARLYGLRDGQTLLGDAPPGPVTYVENGLRFEADVQKGHKTGAFLDQRDNRRRLRELAQDKRVLDVFAYTGGFTVNALAGGARSVEALDISQPALAALRRNVEINGLDGKRAHVTAGDAFAVMRGMIEAKRQFNLVVVDPPALANSRANLEKAVLAYRRLMEMALALLTEDGVLLMSSCSSRINGEMFRKLVERSARVSGFELEIFAETSHGLDHPIGFPEAEYLKAVFARLRG